MNPDQSPNLMIRALILAFLTFVLVTSCHPEDRIQLFLFNPLDQPREDAAILIKRGEIANWTSIPEAALPGLFDENGAPLPCQVDDANMDGEWDELFCLTDFGPKEQKRVYLGFIAAPDYPVWPPRTNLHLGASQQSGYVELKHASRLEGVSYQNRSRTGEVFQMEGPAWENDRVGFRNYLDQRNGMDIFGKLTPRMVMDSVGMEGRPGYHEPSVWGMDILGVGTSLGAGAIGYLRNDSIYRVGDNGSGTYRVIFEGPLRSRFLLSYDPWRMDTLTLKVEHQIEITAGGRCYQSWVTCYGSQSGMDLVAGMVNMHSDSTYLFELDENYTALLTFGRQAEDSTFLTMALMLPSLFLTNTGQTAETGNGITHSCYAVLEALDGEPIPYRFYSLWEKEDPRWVSFDQVKAYLESEAARWTQSLILQAGR